MREFIQKVREECDVKVPEVIEPMVCKPVEIEPWRVFKIMSEFADGFETLQKYGLAATFFGSARCSLGDQIYDDAEELAGKLALRGFTIITGGSHGIMEAANKGAYEAGGQSVGMNIELPNEQTSNPYLTDSVEFDHFFSRKVMLTFAAEVYVYFPGGFGTMDELFEILTLVQTKKIKQIPIVLYGKEYWQPILDLIKTQFAEKHKTISPEDMDLYHLVDSVDEAYEYIIENAKC
ncbi:MAG: TIGR00730 family Rossman fold protein [Patescibacteria group bacterium UBA2103]